MNDRPNIKLRRPSLLAPNIEAGYTAPDGRRWVHVPWTGWEAAGPHIVFPRRRKHWWWSR
ncbi:hypothetical protein [Actinomadura geliboluensis]|uniref:hypothetical protein n=1 Tax=Actinomadura geliboluensis TaxID=882440 RepID=UPI0036CDC92E